MLNFLKLLNSGMSNGNSTKMLYIIYGVKVNNLIEESVYVAGHQNKAFSIITRWSVKTTLNTYRAWQINRINRNNNTNRINNGSIDPCKLGLGSIRINRNPNLHGSIDSLLILLVLLILLILIICQALYITFSAEK